MQKDSSISSIYDNSFIFFHFLSIYQWSHGLTSWHWLRSRCRLRNKRRRGWRRRRPVRTIKNYSSYSRHLKTVFIICVAQFAYNFIQPEVPRKLLPDFHPCFETLRAKRAKMFWRSVIWGQSPVEVHRSRSLQPMSQLFDLLYFTYCGYTVVICALCTGLVPCTAALKQMSHPLPHCLGLETGARRDHEAVMEDLKKKVRSQQDHQESRHVRRLHWRIKRTCFVGWAFLCRWNRNRWQSTLSTQRPARLSPQDKSVTTILERLGHRIKACIHWLRKFVAPAGDATVRQEHQVWRILTMFDVQLGVAMLHFVARPIAARHNAASVLREDALLKQKQAKEIRNTSTVQYVKLIGSVLAIAILYNY